VNGNTFPYTGPFRVLKDDDVTVIVSNYAPNEFVRWQDSLNNIVGPSDTETLDMSLYASESTVTISTKFAAPGDRIVVSLGSDPLGATLYYKIGSLKEYQYTTDFPMERNESLTIRASAIHGTDVFLRWENSSSVIGTTATLSVTLPATGTNATFTAKYGKSVYEVSGTIIRSDTGETIAGVTVSYRINGMIYTTTTDANGNYKLTVPAGASFVMTGISKEGHDPVAGISYPASAAMNADIVADFEMDIKKYDVKLIAKPGTVFEYTLDGVPGTVVIGPSGEGVIADIPYGTVLILLAPEGHTASWEYEYNGKITRSAGKIFTYLVRGHAEVTVELSPDEDDAVSWIPLLVFLAALACFALFFLYLAYRRPIVTGTVTQNGEGLTGIKITYTINGTEYSTVTDNTGKYAILGYRNVDVTIVAVGYAVCETLPICLILREHVTEQDFTM
jgi:hypothetical protein